MRLHWTFARITAPAGSIDPLPGETLRTWIEAPEAAVVEQDGRLIQPSGCETMPPLHNVWSVGLASRVQVPLCSWMIDPSDPTAQPS